MKAQKASPLACRPCVIVLGGPEEVVGHEQSSNHAANEEAWRAWLRIEQAVASVAASVCSPRWTNVA